MPLRSLSCEGSKSSPSSSQTDQSHRDKLLRCTRACPRTHGRLFGSRQRNIAPWWLRSGWCLRARNRPMNGSGRWWLWPLRPLDRCGLLHIRRSLLGRRRQGHKAGIGRQLGESLGVLFARIRIQNDWLAGSFRTDRGWLDGRIESVWLALLGRENPVGVRDERLRKNGLWRL